MPAAYDIIGDIHGQADKLERLLGRLGYVQGAAGWRPPQGHHAVFVGDLVDRGPLQVQTYRIVRSMVDAGDAHCILGNHELNAIGYRTPSPWDPDEHLRARTAQHTRQHAAFLDQVGLGSALDTEIIDWFRTLPFVFAPGDIRVVHAWWNDDHVARLAALRPEGRPLDEGLLHELYARGSPQRAAMEGLTKGEELALPAGHAVIDHGGDPRTMVRTRWWDAHPRTYRDVALIPEEQRHAVPDLPLPAHWRPSGPDGPPVFIGHYWMTGQPSLLTPKLACVDYSAARHGPLVAYRWTGETHLHPSGFVLSDAR
jgi:hypothetical protein